MLFSNFGVKASQGGAVASPYQQWEGYTQSPVLTADFPYQATMTWTGDSNYRYLVVSKNLTLFKSGTYLRSDDAAGDFMIYRYILPSTSWARFNDANSYFEFLQSGFEKPIVEANHDVYADSGRTTVYFAKTTA